MTFVDAVAQILNLDEAAMPEWAVAVVGHVDTEGQLAFKYHVTRGAPAAHVVYALEDIKHAAMHSVTVE